MITSPPGDARARVNRRAERCIECRTERPTHRCMRRRPMLALAALALAAAWPAAPAAAQGPAQAIAAYPSKPIRLVVPFPAGGGTDMLARALGEGLAKELGQTVIVDNKAGAGTVIGNDAVAKSPADGHTLLINTSAFAIAPSLQPRMPYAAETAFAAVTLLGRAPSVAVVRPDSPLASGADFLAQARRHPGKLTYGSAGNGTSTHLAAELLKVSHRIFVTHVPYRGASPVITDLMGGQIDLAFATLPSVAPFIAGGKLRPLAVTGAKRSPLLPGVPTFAELGVRGYEAELWYGIWAPAGVPEAVLKKLHAAIGRVAAGDEFRRRAQGEGLVLSLEPPAQAQAIVTADIARWKKVVDAQSIKAD
jgi:tripartite-type tricarboxylate transporter receptor subunit TctC